MLCPTSKELPPDARGHLVARLNGLFDGAFSPESFTLSQSYFYGAIGRNPSHQAVNLPGKAIDEAEELDAGAIGKPGKPNVMLTLRSQRVGAYTFPHHGTAWGGAALERECAAIRNAGPGGFSFFGSLDISDTSDTDTPLGGCVRLVRVLSEACPVLSVPLFIKCPAFVRRVRALVRGLSESVISDKPNQIATAGNGARFDCGFHRPLRHSARAVRIIRNA